MTNTQLEVEIERLKNEHVAELAKWEEFRDVSIADGADLRQRLEAAELFRATFERPRGLHFGQCCDPVIDGEICALLRRMEAAETARSALKSALDAEIEMVREIETELDSVMTDTERYSGPIGSGCITAIARLINELNARPKPKP